MTQRVSKRRRVAEAITLALASASCGVLFASPVAPAAKPGQRPMMCAGPVLEKAAGGESSVGLGYAFGGWELVSVTPENMEGCVLKAATAAGLYVKFDGGAGNRAMLSSAPSFHLAQGADLPPRRFQFSMIEPVLCETYYSGGSSLLSLTITDANGRVQSVGGIEGLDYKPPVAGDDASARFTPVSAQAAFGPQTQCHAVPYESLAAGAADVPAPGLALTSSIFDSGFEVPVAPTQKADLRVEILDGDGSASSAYLRRNLQATIDQPLQYSIRVRNAGAVAASGIRLREFVVDADAPAAQLEPKVEALTWTCVDRGPGVLQSAPGTACTGGSGVLNVGGAGFNLAAGASRTYTLTRTFPSQLNGSANAEDGQLSVLAAAIFFDPADATGKGDVSLEENLAAAIFQLTENPGPTIACAGLSNLSLSESSSPRSLPYSCTVTDTDGIQSFTATSSDSSKVAASIGAPAGNVYPLTLQIPAYAFTGSPVSITLNAMDALGAAATPLQVTVAISQVNDAPTFSLPVKRVELRRIQSSPAWEDPPVLRDAGGSLIPRSGQAAPVALANCLDGNNLSCTIGIPAVMMEVDAGDPGETAQTVEAVASVCSGGSGPGFVVGQEPIGFVDTGVPITSPLLANRGPVPSSSDVSGDTQFGLTFTYDKRWADGSEVSCYLKVRDSGTPAADTPESDTLTRVIFSRFAGS